MDTAMRDMDQLRERGDESTGRRIGLYVMASVLTVAAVFAMGVMIGRGGSDESKAAPDPLAQLVGPPKAAAAPLEAVPAVDPAALSYPSTLSDRDDPALEATVRAAEREHAALTGEVGIGELAHGPALGSTTAPLEPRDVPAIAVLPAAPAAPLPAKAVAVEDTAQLERVARRDPLVAVSLPKATPPELAPHGHEGAYTLQVVSYDSSAQAERFATSLRSRSHKAFVAQADVEGRGRFYRVRIGPFETKQEAVQYQKSFEASEHMHTILVSADR